MEYNPELSVKEIAKQNGVSESTVRKYIADNKIDRRFEKKLKKFNAVKALQKEHPTWSARTIAKKLKLSPSTVCEYVNQDDLEITKGKISNLEQNIFHPIIDEHLTSIPDELAWVAKQDVSKLRSFLLDNTQIPYITCGMGGAFSTCVYSSLLYGTYNGLGRAVTCYNLNSISDETLLNCKVLINSAGGRNDDVVQVADRLLHLHHPKAANFTIFDNPNNKVKEKIAKLNPEHSINLQGDNLIKGKGAFVNINEAISAFSLYYKAFTGKTDFLNLDFNKTYTYCSNAGKTKVPSLGQIKHFVVLYGSYGEPVAYDFESKMVESGFASVQLADYRNFTHGRFSFVGNNVCTPTTVRKNGDMAVIMLVSPREKETVKDYREIANEGKFKNSNQVLPDWSPIITIETEHDSPLASIDLLYQLTKLYLDISHSRGTKNVEKPVCKNIDKRTPRGKVKFKGEFKKYGALKSTIETTNNHEETSIQTESNLIGATKNRLLGAIIGDIAGSMYEQHEKNVYSYDKALLFPPKSTTKYTDDTVLTIAVARYLLDNDRLSLEGLSEVVHQYTIKYPLPVYVGRRVMGYMYGKNFQKWIKNPKPYQGDSDCSAIRVSSVGWLCDSLEQVMDVAKLTADISHNSKAGEKGAQTIALCVFLARTGKTKSQIKSAVKKWIGYDLSKNSEELRKETKAYVKKNGHISAKCIDTVPHAITAFLESKDYEDAIRLAISIGGDSDCIANMCGAIAVAYYKEIPEWLIEKAMKKLSKNDDFVDVIKRMDEAEPRHYTIGETTKKDSFVFDANTPIDYLRMEEYDGSKIDLVAFSNGQYKNDGHSIGFGNMRNFPINFFGETFLSAETAYIACCYGLNNPDCIRIQREIQKYENALTCKKEYRNRGKKINKIEEQFGRKDFHQSIWHFNLMLYLVWLKCKTHPDFCRDLLAVPDSTVLIENQNEVPTNGIGDWGCLNPDAKKAKRKMCNELQGKGMSEFKAKEAASINTWNIGKWTGMNHCGKILMACRAALRTGTEPYIDYQALNDAEIYLFGEKLTFPQSQQSLIADNRLNNTKSERKIKSNRTNTNLHNARRAKDDEYYTPLNEITDELQHYKKHFHGKTVLCNCDIDYKSNFVRYFEEHYKELGLKKLISIGFSPSDRGRLYIYDGKKAKAKLLKGDGDFRSEESIKYLTKADIVVTNPPFSLFREYVEQLLSYNKQFLIVGNKNAISYREIMTAIKDNMIWSGCRSFNGDMWFTTSSNELVNVAGCWFTNLEHEKRHIPMELTKRYNKKDYPKYDNRDAIDVAKIKDIPSNYTGEMGVPVSFINQYCPEQFDIVGFLYGDDGKHLQLNGKEKYFRVLIKLKSENQETTK